MDEREMVEVARSRGLITETERKRIAGIEDVSDHQRYKAITRVRKRVSEELVKELALLEEHHPELLDEVLEVVCQND